MCAFFIAWTSVCNWASSKIDTYKDIVHPARIKFYFTGSFLLASFSLLYWSCNFKSLESTISLDSLLMGYWLPLSVSAVWTSMTHNATNYHACSPFHSADSFRSLASFWLLCIQYPTLKVGINYLSWWFLFYGLLITFAASVFWASTLTRMDSIQLPFYFIVSVFFHLLIMSM